MKTAKMTTKLTDAQLKALRLVIDGDVRVVRREMAERLERLELVRIRHLHPGRNGWTVVATPKGVGVARDHGDMRMTM
jgi:hypothetical protein